MESMDGSSSDLSKQGLEYANNETDVKRLQQQLLLMRTVLQRISLQHGRILTTRGFAPVVGKGGDAGLANFSAGKSAITLAPSFLKQILQDVNGKFELVLHTFRRLKSSDEGGVSIGGASLPGH